MVAAFSFLCLAFAAQGATFEDSFRAGLVALQKNDLKAAGNNLEAAQHLQPSNGRVWIALAQTYRKLHDDRAEAAAAQAARFSPADKVVQQSLVTYYTEAGVPLKAAEAQARFAALVPADTSARDRAEAMYFEAARPLLQQEKFAEAIQALEAANSSVPKSGQLELALGVAYYGLRRFDEAAAAFLKTIELAPEVEQPYVFLGKFLDQVPSRLPAITKQFLAWEVGHPESATGYLLHAKALNAQSADPAAAAKLLEKSISLNDRDAATHFELGTVFDRLNRFADAAREFGKAAGLAPADPANHYRLARDYDRLGKPAEAAAEREKHAKLTLAQDAAR